MKVSWLIYTLSIMFVGSLWCSAQETAEQADQDVPAASPLTVVAGSHPVLKPFRGNVLKLNQQISLDGTELTVVPNVAESGNLLPYLMMSRQSFASKDGEYLAQKQSELQTYYDLGLTYQYLESPLIRKQLELPSEEGILVQTAKQDAAGYQAGFRVGDLVLRVQDAPVDTQYDFVIAVDESRGKKTAARVKRDGVVTDLSFQLDLAQKATEKRWIIGVSVEEMGETLKSQLQTEGIVVTGVTGDGPAKKMGLQAHDVITMIDDKQVLNLDSLRSAVQESGGKEIRLNLLRSGNKMTVSLTPDEKSDPVDNSLQWLSAPNQAQLQWQVDYSRLPSVSEYALAVDGSKQAESTKLDEILKQIEQLKQQVEELKSADK